MHLQALEVSGKPEIPRGEGALVTDEYRPPFAFTGKIHAVTIDVSGELIKDYEAAQRAVMARQ